jgi:hypothetical protein
MRRERERDKPGQSRHLSSRTKSWCPRMRKGIEDLDARATEKDMEKGYDETMDKDKDPGIGCGGGVDCFCC